MPRDSRLTNPDDYIGESAVKFSANKPRLIIRILLPPAYTASV